MLDFIIKYWIQFIFGLIIAGLGFLCKNYRKLYLKEKNHQKTQEQNDFYDKLIKAIQESYELSKKDDKCLQKQIDEINECLKALKTGILNIQGKAFKQECKKALEDGYEITLERFESIQEDHEVYNGLGGNHDGDSLFDLVEHKYKNNL